MDTRREITLQVSNDPTYLGDNAQRGDVERFAVNLKALVEREFDVRARVLVCELARSTRCPDDSDIDDRLKEIARGDEWIHLLGRSTVVVVVGARVEAGIATDEYDTGNVLAIDGSRCEVGWDSGVRTWIDMADVRPL